jgi:hypothetical protein
VFVVVSMVFVDGAEAETRMDLWVRSSISILLPFCYCGLCRELDFPSPCYVGAALLYPCHICVTFCSSMDACGFVWLSRFSIVFVSSVRCCGLHGLGHVDCVSAQIGTSELRLEKVVVEEGGQDWRCARMDASSVLGVVSYGCAVIIVGCYATRFMVQMLGMSSIINQSINDAMISFACFV